MKNRQIIIFGMMLFLIGEIYSQDKLFFKNGTTKFCKIVALSQHSITYRDTINGAEPITVSKSSIIIAEYKSGAIYIFGNKNAKSHTITETTSESIEERNEKKIAEWKTVEEKLGNNIIGFYFSQLLVGRFTVSYERLFYGKSMGLNIPFSLTYNPFFNRSNQSSSSSSNGSGSNNTTQGVYDSRIGLGFISGFDLNYYYDLEPELKYYFGPRVRYGTDMLLGGIEGLTVQLQNGIFRSRGEHLTSTLGFGVGFFKLSEKYVNYSGYDPKQVYPWLSFTWRLGFRF